jgi:hypothetical protein
LVHSAAPAGGCPDGHGSDHQPPRRVAHNCGTYGAAPAAKMPASTALGRRSVVSGSWPAATSDGLRWAAQHGPWAVHSSAEGGEVRVDLSKYQAVATAGEDLHLTMGPVVRATEDPPMSPPTSRHLTSPLTVLRELRRCRLAWRSPPTRSHGGSQPATGTEPITVPPTVPHDLRGRPRARRCAPRSMVSGSWPAATPDGRRWAACHGPWAVDRFAEGARSASSLVSTR